MMGDEAMNRLLSVLVVAWALLQSGTAWAQSPPDKAKEIPQTLEALEKALAQEFARLKIPGASVAIIENNQIVLTRGYGLADVKARTPVTPETVFRAGSISKSFTGIGIMMLVEEGRLDLNAKLADLVPELKFDNPWESSDPVRLVHLLEHTAGFDDIGFHHYLLEGKDTPLSEAVVKYGPYKSRWRPGTWTAYCNSGPVIAGLIIEKVSGQKFQDFIAERLTGPLGMSSAYWVKDPAIAGWMAKSYKADGVTEEPFIEILARPSGSLNVTAGDLARLAQLMLGRGSLDGRSYFTPATASRIENGQSGAAARAGLKGVYGLGNFSTIGKKAVFHGHDGGIDGFASKLEYAPGKGAGFVLMVNQANEEAFELAGLIRDYLERDWPEAKPSGVALPSADLERWAGLYQDIAPRQQVLALIGSLAAWQPAEATEGALILNGTKRVFLGQGQFRKEDAAAANIVFTGGPEGETLMLNGTGASVKVPLWQAATKAVYGVLFALSCILTLVVLMRLIGGAWRRDGGFLVRLVPTLALLSIVALAGVTLAVLASNDLMLVAKPSALGWAVYSLTIAVPIFGVLAAMTAQASGSEIGWLTRVMAWVNAGLALLAGLYLYQYGWIGLKFWE
ncbi:MAG TPA: hypothetical protein DCL54_07080 [Alphaproteobacteria bacterium]|nr:hypothetical protein [Alphaproteobacteria bacterium]